MPPAGIFAGTIKKGARPETASGLLACLVGRWCLSRRIGDRLRPEGRQGAFEGEAVLERVGDATLAYRETGTLTLAGQAPLRAERRYLWRAAGARVEVAFGDGRPFHTFDPAAPRPEARHDCAPDLYRVAYDFAGLAERPARWEAAWDVFGPRKDYRMVSRYARAG